mgnify:CR=1 FL=1
MPQVLRYPEFGLLQVLREPGLYLTLPIRQVFPVIAKVGIAPQDTLQRIGILFALRVGGGGSTRKSSGFLSSSGAMSSNRAASCFRDSSSSRLSSSLVFCFTVSALAGSSHQSKLGRSSLFFANWKPISSSCFRNSSSSRLSSSLVFCLYLFVGQYQPLLHLWRLP